MGVCAQKRTGAHVPCPRNWGFLGGQEGTTGIPGDTAQLESGWRGRRTWLPRAMGEQKPL